MEIKSKKNLIFWTVSVALLIEWALLAFDVKDRTAWYLENMLAILFFILTVKAYRQNIISLNSYCIVVLFLALHNVGAHYTYSLVPYDGWLQTNLDIDVKGLLNSKRNHYDRLIHFLFGVLLFIPIKEYMENSTSIRKKWLNAITFLVVTAASVIYELLEWLVAVVFSRSAGPEFVGTQGDPWDAQKDQALAMFGALIVWGGLIFYKKIYIKRSNSVQKSGGFINE